jgi:hypothetical protein
MDTDSDRSGLKSINHGSDGLLFTLPSDNVIDSSSAVNNITITSIVSTGVRILFISHTTVILTEVPMEVLKTAIATPVTVVLAELGRCVVVCAVDTFLLGNTSWVSVVTLDSQGAFKSGHGTESPTRSTRSLVLDGVHSAISAVIN